MAKSHSLIGNLVGSLFLLALAAGAFAIAWSIVEEEIMFLSESRIVSGEVVDHIFIKGSETGPKAHRSQGGHYPIVRYVTEDGQEFQVQGRVGKGNRQTLVEGIESGKDSIPVGTTMRVAYRIDNPEDARTLGFDQQYLYPLIISFIGLMFLMFSVLVFRDGISKDKIVPAGEQARRDRERIVQALPVLSWEQGLCPGEKVLWRGKPDPRPSLFGGENGTIILELFVLGFIGFYIFETWEAGEEPDIFSVMPGIIFGILLAISGPLAMAMVRRGTRYALTTGRAIISHNTKIAGITLYQGVDSYPVTEVGVVPSDLRGLRTVNFSRLSQRRPFSEGFEGTKMIGSNSNLHGNLQTRDQLVGFERIADAEEVVELCKKVQEEVF
jgi:hypothetical protein